jgi:hypothetical protein
MWRVSTGILNFNLITLNSCMVSIHEIQYSGRYLDFNWFSSHFCCALLQFISLKNFCKSLLRKKNYLWAIFYEISNKAIFGKKNFIYVYSEYKSPVLAHKSITFAYTNIFMLILSEMLKNCFILCKQMTNFVPIMKIHTPIEILYQI